jgi:anaerobic ribonucleoside-triphosphate reductase activating protein
MRLAYARFACPVEGLGPGERLVLWVSGCSIRCRGCMTPELFSHSATRDVHELALELIPHLQIVPRLTISGGEPFEQAPALTELVTRLRREISVEVAIYTGFVLKELVVRGDACVKLIDAADILIDGPFMESAANTKQWRGSDNQRVHLLSAAAQKYRDVADMPMSESRSLQFAVANGELTIIGIPRRGELKMFQSFLQAQHVIGESR